MATRFHKLCGACVLVSAFWVSASANAQSATVPSAVGQAYGELLAASQKEKKGLMFYVRGQQIGGGVVRIIGNEAVEIRNNTYGRIIIRLDQVDAIAIN